MSICQFEDSPELIAAYRRQEQSRARLTQRLVQLHRDLGLPEYGTPEYEQYQKEEDQRRMNVVKANENYFLEQYNRDPTMFVVGSYVLVQGAETGHPVLRQGTFDQLAPLVVGDCYLGRV